MAALPRLTTIAETRAYSRGARTGGRSVGLVPTMGALHAGHQSLIARAASECDEVIVSVFVNPIQFDNPSDLATYPRTLDADAAAAAEAGATALFVPSELEMYPTGKPLTVVRVLELTEVLEGAHRPGHFDGVTTVCAKLFSICEPDRAYFGEKDYQQLRVVARMVQDLNLGLEVIGCPLVREPDGLALSSRNVRLSPEEREQALSLSRGLLAAQRAYLQGERDAIALKAAATAPVEASAPLAHPDYLELVDAETLKPVEVADRTCVLLTAVRFPSARLIDNVILGPTDR
jgi:pantoate--beta-alanine ligase